MHIRIGVNVTAPIQQVVQIKVEAPERPLSFRRCYLTGHPFVSSVTFVTLNFQKLYFHHGLRQARSPYPCTSISFACLYCFY